MLLLVKTFVAIVTLTAELNKSNLTANAVQVEENLQEQLCDHLHCRKQKCC